MTLFPDIIGWVSSAILLATLVRQIVKQHREGGDGVSHWLFAGQTAASIGFVIYSVLVKNPVFVVTNGLILLTAVVGYLLQRRRGRHASAAESRD